MEDPLWTVVNPPQARRLRARLGLEPSEPVDLRMRGWSKRVALTKDRALLFPRDHHNVDFLRNEATSLRALAQTHAPVPRVLDWIDDPEISPYPILVVTRLTGEPLEADLPSWNLDALGDVLDDVARAAASWHQVDPLDVTSIQHGVPDRGVIDPILGSGSASEIADRLGVKAKPAWSDALHFIRSLEPVLIHADLHEAQLLVENGKLSGIIDWQTATVSHPYVEFRFEEWGTWLWRTHRSAITPLRRRQWTIYAELRGLDPDHVKTFDWMWAAYQLESGAFPDVARDEFDAASAQL